MTTIAAAAPRDDAVLVCQLKGEPRDPPPRGDHDIVTCCGYCRATIIHRASAPKLKPICHVCWAETETQESL